jgi:hypothetical protein
MPVCATFIDAKRLIRSPFSEKNTSPGILSVQKERIIRKIETTGKIEVFFPVQQRASPDTFSVVGFR